MHLDREAAAVLLLVAGAAVAGLAAIVYDPENPVVVLLPVAVGGLLIALGIRALVNVDEQNLDGPTSK